MQIIISHVNTDFDAFASMIAAKKLYPDAQLVISDKQDDRVSRFLNIYRDQYDFIRDIDLDWSTVETMILVDVASLSRIGKLPADFARENVNIIVYDHHPHGENNVKADGGIIEPVGAAVTLLVEKIREKELPMTEFEATLFGVGIYTDTGNLIYKNTTTRDLQAVVYLMEKGMNLSLIQRFSEQILEPQQRVLLDQLLIHAETHEIDGLEIVVSTYELKKFQSGLSLLTNQLMRIKGADAAITVVKMKNHVHIVGRASSNRVTLLPLLKKFAGGGHQQAGSAMVKNSEQAVILEEVVTYLPLILTPGITARAMMSQPVKSLTPDTSIEEAGRLMYRYGHSGYPIIEEGRLIGLITRRDLDKGNHHGLGHAPVKAYMTTDVVTIEPDTTLEEIQDLIIERNIGRLPVLENEEMIGIVTRTNVIEKLHSEMTAERAGNEALHSHLQVEMEAQLSPDIFTLLTNIGEAASDAEIPVYLIGGIVRDVLLKKPNDDIDIVVEGDGIQFAQDLCANYGGEMIEHGQFGTATWTHPSGNMIDITSSRLEYYERPASLPDVELSTLEEDLHRRDFTINAMALRLNRESFGALIDPFGGQKDLQEKTVKVLHNLSFIDDPTRIFRAIRFEGRYQFKMDEQTENLVLNSIDKVKDLSANRIIEEMKRLFKEGEPSAVMTRLFELNFWQQFGISQQYEERSCQNVKALQAGYDRLEREEPSWFTYFLMPFYTAGNMKIAAKFALTKSELKLLQEVVELSGDAQWGDVNQVGDYHPILRKYAAESILFVVATKKIQNEQLLTTYLQKRDQLPRYFVGGDLVQLGIKPGPLFSALFLQFKVAQLNGEIQSKEAALQWVENFIALSVKD